MGLAHQMPTLIIQQTGKFHLLRLDKLNQKPKVPLGPETQLRQPSMQGKLTMKQQRKTQVLKRKGLFLRKKIKQLTSIIRDNKRIMGIRARVKAKAKAIARAKTNKKI